MYNKNWPFYYLYVSLLNFILNKYRFWEPSYENENGEQFSLKTWVNAPTNNIFFIKLLHNVLSQSKICIQAMLKFNSNCLMQLWTYSSFNHFCHDYRNSNSRLLQASDNPKQTWIHTWECECILNTLNLWWNISSYKIRQTDEQIAYNRS